MLTISTFLTCSLSSQSTLQFKSLTQKEGLSNNFVQCIYQDYNGFIWIGTENGLDRFDGYKVVTIKEDPKTPEGFRGNWINAIVEDSRLNLWVGTNKGLNIIKDDLSNIIHLPIEQSKDPSEIIHVINIDEDKYGNIWVGTSNGLYKITVSTNLNNSTIDHILPNDKVEDFWINKDIKSLLVENEHVWITNGSLVYRYNIPNQKVEYIDTEASILAATYRHILKRGNDGKILFGTHRNGIYQIEKPNSYPLLDETTLHFHKNTSSVSFSENWLNDLSLIEGGQWWAATEKGLYKININTGQSSSFHHNPNDINSIASDFLAGLYQDKDQNLWIATEGWGLSILPNQTSPFIKYQLEEENEKSLSHNHVRALIKENNGYIWVGTLGGGIDKMQYTSEGRWEKVANINQSDPKYKTLPSNEVIDMIQSKDGNIWVGMVGQGLVKLDPENSSIKTHKHNNGESFDFDGIWALEEDDNGFIWIGTRKQGVYKFDPKSDAVTSFEDQMNWQQSIGNNFVYDIYKDAHNSIWFSTSNGLHKYDQTNNKISSFYHDPKDENSISDSWVWSIYEDQNKNTWVATNQGLNRFDQNSNTFERFYQEDGLPSNLIVSMTEDNQGNLWLATDLGLARKLATKTGEKESFISFSSDLLDNTFVAHAILKDEATGHLLFGGPNGLNEVVTTSIKSDELPKMTLSSITKIRSNEDKNVVFHDPFISKKESINLSYLDDVITFSFSDLNYNSIIDNSYQYQLAGLSEQWIPLEEHKTITFIDLDAGSYVLNMKGRTGFGEEIAVKKMIRLNVSPPIWASIWAYVFYIIMALSFIYGIYRFISQRQKEKAESQRLKEMDELKSRLFTNITHELRTPLTLIMGMADQMKSTTTSLKAKQVNIAETIQRNSNNLLNLVNQILDLSKVENNMLKVNYINGDILSYSKYISESFHSIANHNNIMVRVSSNHVEIRMDYDSERYRQILSNLISNAIKYSTSGDRIDILLSRDQVKGLPHLIVEVKDTGAGIPPEDIPHVFDRFYQANDDIAQSGGTGIGLAITQELVKLMDGQIKVKSSLNKGTTFTFNIPIKNEAKTTNDIIPPIPKMPYSKSAIEQNNIKHTQANLPNLLIIEDNPDVVNYLEMCLTDHYNLDYAYNGKAGIEKAIEQVPDIIVSDVMMPQADGFEVCERIKNNEKTSHIPIILLTAKADIKSRIKGIKRGADAYLGKPFIKEELISILENLIVLRRKLQTRYSTGQVLLSNNSSKLPNIDIQIEDAFITRLNELLMKKLDDSRFGIPMLCKTLAMSRTQLHNKIKALTGLSTSIYWRNFRLQKAHELLKDNSLNISEVAYSVGFDDPKYFSRVFSEHFSMSPSEYRIIINS